MPKTAERPAETIKSAAPAASSVFVRIRGVRDDGADTEMLKNSDATPATAAAATRRVALTSSKGSVFPVEKTRGEAIR